MKQRKHLGLTLTIAAVGIVGALGSYLYNFGGRANAMSFAGNPLQAGALAAKPAGNPCLSTLPRHVEVCTAYISNSSLAARLPYYRYSNSTNRQLVIDVSNRLASRYTGQAFTYVFNQTAGWPASVDVSAPIITVRTVTVTPDENFATLTTFETWSVRTESGAPLFVENRAPHTIHMARVPGLVLHKWVVTSIQ